MGRLKSILNKKKTGPRSNIQKTSNRSDMLKNKKKKTNKSMLITYTRNQPSTSSSASAVASSNPPSRPSPQNTTATKWSAGNVTSILSLPFTLSHLSLPIHPPFTITITIKSRLTHTHFIAGYARLPPRATNCTLPPTPTFDRYITYSIRVLLY